MDELAPNCATAARTEILPPGGDPPAEAVASPSPTSAGQAALVAAKALAKRATAAATLRAYKADWTHFSQWYATHGFVCVPAAPATVGAYLASLAASHAPTIHAATLDATLTYACNYKQETLLRVDLVGVTR